MPICGRQGWLMIPGAVEHRMAGSGGARGLSRGLAQVDRREGSDWYGCVRSGQFRGRNALVVALPAPTMDPVPQRSVHLLR